MQGGTLEASHGRAPRETQSSTYSSPRRLSRFGVESIGESAAPNSYRTSTSQPPADAALTDTLSAQNGLEASSYSEQLKRDELPKACSRLLGPIQEVIEIPELTCLLDGFNLRAVICLGEAA